MNRKGFCCDNAAAENFCKILKSELIYQIPTLDIGQTQLEIFEFIEIWKNKKRKLYYLDYLISEQFGIKAQNLAG